MKSLKERIAIEQAYLDGADVEHKADGINWQATINPDNRDDLIFYWQNFDYRIKQEPMEFWVNVHGSGFLDVFSNDLAAEKAASMPTIKTLKVREVTDES